MMYAIFCIMKMLDIAFLILFHLPAILAIIHSRAKLQLNSVLPHQWEGLRPLQKLGPSRNTNMGETVDGKSICVKF